MWRQKVCCINLDFFYLHGHELKQNFFHGSIEARVLVIRNDAVEKVSEAILAKRRLRRARRFARVAHLILQLRQKLTHRSFGLRGQGQ